MGEIGRAVHCAIYPARPSPCQSFGITWQPNGELSGDAEAWQRCTAARAAFGLPPLSNPPTYHQHAPIAWEAYYQGKHHRGKRLSYKSHHNRRRPGGTPHPLVNPVNYNGSGA